MIIITTLYIYLYAYDSGWNTRLVFPSALSSCSLPSPLSILFVFNNSQRIIRLRWKVNTHMRERERETYFSTPSSSSWIFNLHGRVYICTGLIIKLVLEKESIERSISQLSVHTRVLKEWERNPFREQCTLCDPYVTFVKDPGPLFSKSWGSFFPSCMLLILVPTEYLNNGHLCSLCKKTAFLQRFIVIIIEKDVTDENVLLGIINSLGA